MRFNRLFADSMGDEHALSRQARLHMARLGDELPDSRALAELTVQQGTNLASRLFYEALHRDPRHGRFIRRVDNSPLAPAPVPAAPTLVIVPGMFFNEYPEIGADGELLSGIASQFAVSSSVVPTLSLGSVQRNVEILHRFLSEREAGPFWLASMSRGSTEVKWLMQEYPDAPYLKDLRGWLSICGILSGTPLHEHIYSNRVLRVLYRGLARLNRIDPDLLGELRASSDRWHPTLCPPGVRVINVIAVPASWHVTTSAVRRYRRICHLGPTDGVVRLGDYLTEPGVIYPVWGVDHFMRTSRVSPLFYRLLYYLLIGEGENHAELHARDSVDVGGNPECRSAGRP